jgi:hypothetical protein
VADTDRALREGLRALRDEDFLSGFDVCVAAGSGFCTLAADRALADFKASRSTAPWSWSRHLVTALPGNTVNGSFD